MGTPGMIKVNLRTPPEPASKPNPKPNDKADDPEQKSIVAATTPVSTPTRAIPGANTDLKANPKITLDPPCTSALMLPAPNPSKDAPQNIQDPLLGVSTTLLTTTNP